MPPAQAQTCSGCPPGSCIPVRITLTKNHARGEFEIKRHLKRAVDGHQEWWKDTFLSQMIVPAMMRMTEQLSAVGMYQMMMIGSLFDAKHQIETQQLFREQHAQATKDYHPSREFCAFGGNTRSLAASHEKTRYNTGALNQIAMARHLGAPTSVSMEDGLDVRRRFINFTEKYDPARTISSPDDALRTNIDIDFTRLVESPRTLPIDLTDGSHDDSKAEQDIIALARNLYGHKAMTRNIGNIRNLGPAQNYFDFRSVIAKRSVAENSFNAIVGLKSAGSEPASGAGYKPTRETMAAILKQLGMPEDEIFEYLGENPSYFAQLEMLGKKIFQQPGFYSGLYDKPVNIQRRKAAMRAVEMLLDREIYESRLRQETITAVLAETEMRDHVERVERNIAGLTVGAGE